MKKQSRRETKKPGNPSLWVFFLGVAVLGAGAFLLWKFGIDADTDPAGTSAGGGPGASRDSEIRRTLQSILGEAKKDPTFTQASDILRRFRDFREEHRGTRWEARASKEEARYRKGLEETASRELNSIRKETRPLRGKGRWGAALKRLRSFPARYLETTRAGQTVQDEIQTLRGRIREQYAKDLGTVTRLLREGKVAEAETRMRFIAGYIGKEERTSFLLLRGEVDKKKKEAADHVRKGVMDRYLETDGAFRRAMKAGDYRSAARVVTRFLFSDWKEKEKPLVFRKGVDYAVLRGFIDDWSCEDIVRICDVDPSDPATLAPADALLLDLRSAALLDLLRMAAGIGLERAIQAGKKETYELEAYEKQSGYFFRRNKRVYFLASNDRIYPFHLLRTPTPQDLLMLAVRAWDKDRDKAMDRFQTSPRGQASAALLFHFGGSVLYMGSARKHFQKALELRARGVRIYVANLKAAADARKLLRLTSLYEQAGELLRKKRLCDAWVALDELIRDGDHEFVKARRAHIDSMLKKVNAGLSLLQRFSLDFRGRVEFLKGKKIRIHYDFSKAKQLEAFESIEKIDAQELYGRWRLRRGGLESGKVASAIRWRMLMRGDVRIEFDLTPLETPQNIVIDLYYNPGRRSHYAATFGFDWVGKARGDRKNTIEDKFGMPRTCIIKYPVRVVIDEWEKPASWRIWRNAVVGKRVADGALTRGVTSRIVFERSGTKLRMALNGLTFWEGRDVDYDSGFINFFSDSRARIDNLSFTFTPAE